MTRCNSENNFPLPGLAWLAPTPLRCELETERLLIRSYHLGDADEVFQAIQESRENHLLPWMPWAKENHHNLESTTKYICEQMISLANPATFNNVGVGIFSKSTGRFLGGTGIHDVRADTASCEAGYWIRRDDIGNGYAKEACARIISWALDTQARAGLGLHRVRIYCSSANIHSTNLINQLELKQEVHQRQDYFIQGVGPTDRLGWGVMNSEWDCINHRTNL
ncbi:MAG: GNAT family N-acetyltransferase [Phycisphaerales bacterium]